MKISILVSLLFPLFSFSQITTQEQSNSHAGCIPVHDANTGEINRYECDQVKLRARHSLKLEQLGIQKMNVIKTKQPQKFTNENLQPDESVQEAMQLYNTLKESGQTKLQIEKQPDQEESK